LNKYAAKRNICYAAYMKAATNQAAN